MWPFSRRIRRNEIQAAFSKYLSPGAISFLETGSADQLSTRLEPVPICFILLQVRDDDLAKAASSLAFATDILVRHGGVVVETMSSCMLAIFGHPVRSAPGEAQIQRDKAASHLVADLGESVRLVCGDADGLVGAIASERRLRYGCLIPQLEKYFLALIALSFGKVGRISTSDQPSAGFHS